MIRYSKIVESHAISCLQLYTETKTVVFLKLLFGEGIVTKAGIFLKFKIKQLNIWVLWPFQEYLTYIEPIVNQTWANIEVPGAKTPDLSIQNLASHMYPKRGSNHSGERSNI